MIRISNYEDFNRLPVKHKTTIAKILEKESLFIPTIAQLFLTPISTPIKNYTHLTPISSYSITCMDSTHSAVQTSHSVSQQSHLP
jgi:hypothetical protein